jgi:hypothetical protein
MYHRQWGHFGKDIPQGLKPEDLWGRLLGTAEAVPFQNMRSWRITAMRRLLPEEIRIATAIFRTARWTQFDGLVLA